MFTYHQRSGQMFQGGTYLSTGWAGQLQGQNNPAYQGVANTGPLPQGKYAIGEAYIHPRLGPIVMNLDPDPANEMFGRSLFRIHGSSHLHPELSSHGCIVLPRFAREHIAASDDCDLEVVE